MSLLPAIVTGLALGSMAMLEINPLVVTKQGELKCLDAKVNFDSNALYRHPDVVKLRDLTEEDGKEIEASKYDLNYIALDGDIGCMPSRLRFNTPARSLSISPVAAKMIGTARRSPEPMNTAICSSIIGSTFGW